MADSPRFVHVFPRKFVVAGYFVVVALSVIALVSAGTGRLSTAPVGVLAGDSQLGPMRPGGAISQSLAVRYAEVTRAAVNLLLMSEEGSGDITLTLRQPPGGEILRSRTISTLELTRQGRFVEIVDTPLAVRPNVPLELRIDSSPDGTGGVGATVLSGNRFSGGSASFDGVPSENDLVFIVDSRGTPSEVGRWFAHRAARLLPWAASGALTQVGAIVALMTVAAIVLLLSLAPRTDIKS